VNAENLSSPPKEPHSIQKLVHSAVLLDFSEWGIVWGLGELLPSRQDDGKTTSEAATSAYGRF
jgi:hypothetical protein